MSELMQGLQHRMETFVRDSSTTRLQRIDGRPIFGAPLLGVADGDEPLFEQYKRIIGPFHLIPREALRYSSESAPAGVSPSLDRVRVLCWVLPITEQTRLSNRREDKVPSRRWAHTRWFGEQFNDELRRYVVGMLQDMGFLAIAPVVSPLFRMISEGLSRPPASTWSERHILFAAGLGTFGLSDGFITPRGMAMRCGSVVSNAPLPVTPRRYASHTENCLHYRSGACDKCVERCPAGAITQDGHDKERCRAYSYGELLTLKEQYGVGVTGCGLCQTGVPCEAGIPENSSRSAR